MGKELRGSNHSDPTVDKLVADPAMKAAIDARTPTAMDRAKDTIESVLKATDNRELKGWVIVCAWEDENGLEHETVMGDSRSTPIQQKGYLHSGVWVNAHADA